MHATPQTIRLSDYKRPAYWVEHTQLEVDIFSEYTLVTATLNLRKNAEYSERLPVQLDGQDLELLEIAVDQNPLTDYQLTPQGLKFNASADKFQLKTKVKIYPEKNLSCEGLYKSGHIYCTQNEAEGFRKITFYPDRPDVMSKFTTRISADKKTFPLLLANGNPVEKGDLADNRHFVIWEDPFLKPCYLFALVAGDLAVVKDHFVTKSGRKVALEIYVDKGNENKCDHAMASLKNAMKWDEDVFGLEYDLDIYMVVAVDAFNMGAMENKGLNIFNSAYVLARPDTATDGDFQGIEAVIGHEYFHNWTGNRVTCRDWFQLTLKEGLTVFRDQEFSSDMLSRPVKRIEDVMRLRQSQFAEDAGPMSHPIKPKSYIEINNFYTATVYEKGAEVIRMIHTLIGAENFRKGMDLYFKRHDGQAVTTEDFVAAMADASGKSLDQFKVWYDQNGTPLLTITTHYDQPAQTFSIKVKQMVKTNNKNYQSLHMPFLYGLILEDGTELQLPDQGRRELTELETRWEIKNVPTRPTPSWNRNFSAPVRIDYEYSDKELGLLMAHDSDEFNRYNATQTLYKNNISKWIEDLKHGNELVMGEDFKKGFGKMLNDSKLDPAFLAFALNVPPLAELLQEQQEFDFENTNVARNFLIRHLAESYQEVFAKRFEQLSSVSARDLSSKAMGARKLRNMCALYLASLQSESSYELVKGYYTSAQNMTQEYCGLKLLIDYYGDRCVHAVDAFYKKWKNETLVIQKWLTAQATANDPKVLNTIKQLEACDVYDSKVPNLFRALVLQFAANNPMQFNAPDGSGYAYLADKIIQLDAINPQIASRAAKSMNHLSRLDPARAALLKKELQRMLEHDLSRDTFEVVSKNLGQ